MSTLGSYAGTIQYTEAMRRMLRLLYCESVLSGTWALSKSTRAREPLESYFSSNAPMPFSALARRR